MAEEHTRYFAVPEEVRPRGYWWRWLVAAIALSRFIPKRLSWWMLCKISTQSDDDGAPK